VTHLSRVRFVRTEDGPAVRAARYLEAGRADVWRSDHETHVEASFAGQCRAPITMRETQGEVMERFTTDLIVRCRHCDWCLRQRRKEWTARALREMALLGDKRTWFVTLTVQPSWRFKHQALARTRHAEHWDYMSQKARANAGLNELGATVTTWLKRFRKRSERRAGAEDRAKPRIRFVAAFEEHEDGEWHCHMLCHEAEGQVREQDFRTTWWPVGFAQATLVKSKSRAAFYVAKYLAYDGPRRIRASLRYGHGGLRMTQPKGA
jgi:hypothetical protein